DLWRQGLQRRLRPRAPRFRHQARSDQLVRRLRHWSPPRPPHS
ncbi:hypothetical protein BN1723_019323, partial [Verticillium longisporum]